jgi:hypothetical protein
MLLRMVDESAAVAREVDPAAAEMFDHWAALRRSQASAGALSLQVGHQDLLALPGGPQA